MVVGDHVTLAGGTPAVIRPIEAGDNARLAKAFSLLSDETRNRRFLAPKPRLTPRELRYLTEVDGCDHAALVAVHAELAAADRATLWHPFTQQQGWADEDPVVVERAEGTTLWDTKGNAYIDGVSSLWCNVHGHGHHAIDAAIRHQLERVAHSTLLGLTHRPAIELASRLVDLAPAGLRRVFFSDNGSTAAEVALKMAFQFWAQAGQPRRTGFVHLRDAYHGDTVGSVSVGGIELFH